MIPIFREDLESLQIHEVKTTHFPPHLHQSLELIMLKEGSLELGVRTEFYHMEPGDFALIAPGLIHHFQVFSTTPTKSVHLLASPSCFDPFSGILTEKMPKNPVILSKDISEDVPLAFSKLMKNANRSLTRRKISKDSSPSNMPASFSEGTNFIINHSYFMIALARMISSMEFVERPRLPEQDLVYQVVAYIAGEYKENISLTSMAKDLCISPFALSRIFSSVFHVNFNTYLNNVRLNHAEVLLRRTNNPITDIFLDCGFQSQATFNRVFQEKYKMTPRTYRKTQRTN